MNLRFLLFTIVGVARFERAISTSFCWRDSNPQTNVAGFNNRKFFSANYSVTKCGTFDQLGYTPISYFFSLQECKESNSDLRFWRLPCYHYTTLLYLKNLSVTPFISSAAYFELIQRRYSHTHGSRGLKDSNLRRSFSPHGLHRCNNPLCQIPNEHKFFVAEGGLEPPRLSHWVMSPT